MGEEGNGGEKELISRGSKTVFHRVKDVVVDVVVVVVVVVVGSGNRVMDGRSEEKKKMQYTARKRNGKTYIFQSLWKITITDC